MILLAGAMTALLSGCPAALHSAVTAEAGLEYDSNANRVEDGSGEQARGSPLLRTQVRGLLQEHRGRHQLRLQVELGAKLFFLPVPEVQYQNVGVVQLNYEETAQLGRLRLGGMLDYYDAYQQAPVSSGYGRDVRAAGTGLRLGAAAPIGQRHRFDTTVDLTGQLFMYKPDSGFTFSAPSLQGQSRLLLHAGDPELGHDFEIALRGRLDDRSYFLAPLSVSDPTAPVDRTELYGEVGGGLTWIGPALVQLGYGLQINQSTQSIQSYQRHTLQAKLAVRVPGDVLLTIKGLLTSAIVVPTATIDEDRSLAMVDLQRALPRGFALSCRYTGFFNLSWLGGTAPGYQRHTIYLGVSYRFRVPER